MRSYIALSALCALATAVPFPQDDAESAPSGCTYRFAYGAGPVPGNGTTSDYLDLDNQLSQSAQTAATPSGYMSVFNNLQSSNFQPFSYMTYSILPGNQYDVAACATNCNRTTGCSAFNIYYERQPMYQITDDCPDPPPVTNIMCALYSQPISAADATNQGQTYVSRDGENFAIVIAGSNGYDRVVSPNSSSSVVGFFHIVDDLGNAAIISPPEEGTYMGYHLYPEDRYKPEHCADRCDRISEFDDDTDPNNQDLACTFFNAYLLSQNGQPAGAYCAFYSQVYDSSYATNTGYTDQDDGDVYTISNSYTYVVNTDF